MKNFLIMALMGCLYAPLNAQNTLYAYIKDGASKESLPGAAAILIGTTNGSSSDMNGFVVVQNIPSGNQSIEFRSMGYRNHVEALVFPMKDTLVVYLEPDAIEDQMEVVISSTRSSRSISDVPTRVEFIAGEELEEKANMKPGDIRMVLAESTGIQTQQTSATSANSSIRIQGLDGRYTQILKDGFPLYSGYSGGLGLLQTPPLDLKQIEVVKGSASTLYGGGAIAGLVNLLSKTPSEEKELRFILNGTSAGGLDISGFYSQLWKKKSKREVVHPDFPQNGITVYAARNSNIAYDPAGIDLSAIPRFERYTINPRWFINFTPKTNLVLGVNASSEQRMGGDMHYIKGKGDSTHRYYERNNSQRFSTQLTLEHKFGACSHLTFKNSFSTFNRLMEVPDYRFDGRQNATYTELNYANHGVRTEWITGLNILTDRFIENTPAFLDRDYNQITVGAFIQNTVKAASWLHIESGLRYDYVVNYVPVLLPRVSLLLKINPKLTSRLGAGLGYKAPTIFTEETERLQYGDLLPIQASVRLERSEGINWDVNYRTGFMNGFTFSINQLFFYTRLNRPLILKHQGYASWELVNMDGHTDCRGAETNLKLGYKHFKLFLGYTLTDAKNHVGNFYSEKELTSRHRINSVLMYEVEDKWKAGLEAYYFSKQWTDDGLSKDYWLCGFMMERIWEHISVYINFENFLDVRQTRFEKIYKGSLSAPVFNQIYAPLDGFVVNGGIKIKI